ncbi:fatty acyl-CoA synthetase [Amycolatopsis jejuensis]|uniref:fatty acyl-CoA synthetase n=1 Tax=Amycolatopsis jejuensis TaxID=330084 RepID=UPI000525C143|nr:fatty acyl-CoA synthetase [Amycolatopsis jejuensis]
MTAARVRRNSLGDVLRRSARRHPDRVALREGGTSLTYAQLDLDVNRLANALAERGIGQGDRVAVLSRNSTAYVLAIFAVARLGAVLVPVNFMLTAGEAGYVLKHSGAIAVLSSTELAEVADQAIGPGDPARVLLDNGKRTGWENLSALLAEGSGNEPVADIAPDDLAQILYTSGTESRPKGAMLSHSALMAQYASCVADGEMSTSDIEVHALPLFHCAQQHCFLVPDLMLGATSIILPGADPAAILAAVEEFGATKLFAPPTVWIGLLRHPDFDRRDLSTLHKGYYGAAIMPVPVLHEIAKRLPDLRLWNFYGQTEMAPLAVVLRPEDQMRKAGAAGKAALNVETRVVDPVDGRELPPGEVGEIVHRSPQALLGYLDDEAATEQVFRGGWFHSGDLGVLDEDGYLTVVDRIKDMIKTGGENVAGREVEEVLHRHEAVAEAAVIGVPHPQWIEAVVAIVVPKDGQTVTEDDIRSHARAHLAPFKVPKAVTVVPALPKNASGKVLKRVLREEFAAAAEKGD